MFQDISPIGRISLEGLQVEKRKQNKLKTKNVVKLPRHPTETQYLRDGEVSMP
jgi:hypothetical protein